jgi:hypothetical protein
MNGEIDEKILILTRKLLTKIISLATIIPQNPAKYVQAVPLTLKYCLPG